SAHELLKPFDLRTDRRLREIQRFSGLRKVAGLLNHHERAQELDGNILRFISTLHFRSALRARKPVQGGAHDLKRTASPARFRLAATVKHRITVTKAGLRVALRRANRPNITSLNQRLICSRA